MKYDWPVERDKASSQPAGSVGSSCCRCPPPTTLSSQYTVPELSVPTVQPHLAGTDGRAGPGGPDGPPTLFRSSALAVALALVFV